jgi:hypothetical protein
MCVCVCVILWMTPKHMHLSRKTIASRDQNKLTVSSGWYGSSITISPFEHRRRFGDECRLHHIWNLNASQFRRQHINLLPTTTCLIAGTMYNGVHSFHYYRSVEPYKNSVVRSDVIWSL